MLFNSYLFLMFFPVCLILYYIIPNKHNMKKIWLIICSYYFYSCYNYLFAFVIFFITLVGFLFGNLIDKQTKNSKKITIITVIFLVILLLIYKVINVKIEDILLLINKDINLEDVKMNAIIPIGVSFYILQTISYLIDVYKKKITSEKSIINYMLYISFFPQLVAGPIERAGDFLKQTYTPKKFDYESMKSGLLIMLYGFFQKLVIANRAALFVDNVYNNLENSSFITIIVATFIFGIQIYCDFAGYSNIAIGAAKTLGFNLSKNFDRPYLSCSISEFWSRWHITLSSFLKDYIYIPLKGNKCSKSRNALNLMITFVISGIWHGFNFTFLIWGALNGILIIIDKNTKEFSEKLPKFSKWISTYILINLTWLFFRLNSILDIKVVFKKLCNEFVSENQLSTLLNNIDKYDMIMLVLAILIMYIISKISIKHDIKNWIFNQNIVLRWIIYYVIIFYIIIFGVYGIDAANTAFIYTNF